MTKICNTTYRYAAFVIKDHITCSVFKSDNMHPINAITAHQHGKPTEANNEN